MSTDPKPDPVDRACRWALATLAGCLWVLWTLAVIDLIGGGAETAAAPVAWIAVVDLPLTVGLFVWWRTTKARRGPMADRFVILTCSSYGERVDHDEPYGSAEEARDIAESMAEDASTADIPETYSVHKLSEALWEG